MIVNLEGFKLVDKSYKNIYLLIPFARDLKVWIGLYALEKDWPVPLNLSLLHHPVIWIYSRFITKSLQPFQVFFRDSHFLRSCQQE